MIELASSRPFNCIERTVEKVSLVTIFGKDAIQKVGPIVMKFFAKFKPILSMSKIQIQIQIQIQTSLDSNLGSDLDLDLNRRYRQAQENLIQFSRLTLN